jgi:asparagine synthase (glutamine-hydrolysing)
MSLANSLFGLGRVAKYEPLMNDRFPDYYYSRTSNPHRSVGNGAGSVYSPDFLKAVDRERSLEPMRAFQAHVRGHHTLDAMLYLDTKTWLPDNLLVKADKMTMANSIELRVPLLDHKVLEFAASLPSSLKLNGLTTKFILKKALSGRIPKEIRNRKKSGFPVPYESWLRTDLKDLVWNVLMDSRTINRGYFRKTAIEGMLRANSNGSNCSKDIFSLLSLELWHRTFLENEQVVL